MTTSTRYTLGAGGIFVVAMLTLFVWRDFNNKPLCHKQLWATVSSWWTIEKTDDLPNLDGNSTESLSKLWSEDADYAAEWNAKYQYIPGLKRGDPGDLILVYLKQPTRWKNHATSPPSWLDSKKWLIVPFDFAYTLFPPDVARVDPQLSKRVLDQGGECSEQISLEDFKMRLRKTLKFLEDNNRPHWQTVVAENEAFLKSLESE
jgi:hypothetical protein